MFAASSSMNKAHIASGRFAYLMGLYGENYWRITRLFAPQRLAPGTWVSSVGDGLDVHLHVIERHPYTLELQLSYAFPDELTGRPDPSAHIRLYTDARAAEVTTCYFGPRLEDVLGRYADNRAVFDHRLRMNNFFNKWLEYLGERGHSRFTLRELAPAASAS
jgi:uncharacterized protein